MQSRKQGYTLAEMIFVLALSSIVMAISLFPLSSGYERHALKQTIRQVETTLLLAKLESMTKHQQRSIDFRKDEFEYRGEIMSYHGKVRLQSPQQVFFNEHGHIRQATTLRFYTKHYEQSIVVWLGQGVYRVSDIRLSAP